MMRTIGHGTFVFGDHASGDHFGFKREYLSHLGDAGLLFMQFRIEQSGQCIVYLAYDRRDGSVLNYRNSLSFAQGLGSTFKFDEKCNDHRFRD
jgi:hypothetical protein